MTLKGSDRKHLVDQKFESDIKNENFDNVLFIRLISKKIKFEKIDFRYTIFDSCYLRNCSFDSCNFTGCRFINVNFYGSSFSGCTFDYATFDKTIIDSEILDVGCPGWENLKLKFARTLRVNFQQLGDSQAANKAIKVELDATERHLYKAWQSNESYYRKKYKGIERFYKFFEWVNFEILGFIWGNGESIFKLIRFVLIFLGITAIIDVAMFKDLKNIPDYLFSFLKMIEVFIGVTAPDQYHRLYLSFIVFTRLVTIGFFMSIIIKRLNRR